MADGLVAQFTHALLERSQTPFGIGQKGTSGVGQADTAPAAHQEDATDVALKALQPGGKGRLSDVQPLRRQADAATPHGLHEAFDLGHLHARPPYDLLILDMAWNRCTVDAGSA